MRIPGRKTARQAWRWGRSRLVDHALILGYHRVATPPFDPFGLAVSPENFAQQLEVLRRMGRLLRPAVLADGIELGRLPRRGVLLTFDDGYADMITTVKPLLERYDLPAVSFVVSGNLGRPFWWDELAHLLFSPTDLPAQLPDGAGGGSSAGGREALLALLFDRLRRTRDAVERDSGFAGDRTCEERFSSSGRAIERRFPSGSSPPWPGTSGVAGGTP